MAFCKYRTPPCISFVLRLLVPEEKSSSSIRAVFSPQKREMVLLNQVGQNIYFNNNVQSKIKIIFHKRKISTIYTLHSLIFISFIIQLSNHTCLYSSLGGVKCSMCKFTSFNQILEICVHTKPGQTLAFRQGLLISFCGN